MSLIIALPRESRAGELRVALDPPVVAQLRTRLKVDVRIEAGCGRGAGLYDGDYESVTVVESFADVVNDAELVVKVMPPSVQEAALLPAGSILLCLMSAFQHLDVIKVLLQRRITTLAMDLLPRITRAQPMDALSSQATVAGYKAALLAAELSPRLFPMLTTAAGTIRPSRVIIIGAGVAGLQAIATARRLGAQVEAYDIRRAAREQIESLGARIIDTGVEAEGKGGYARALSKEEKQKQHDVLAERLSHAHAVICAAAIPGRHAPRIITEEMVEGMLPDTVIVDMAADTGGNCELTRPGESYLHGDTLIVGAINLPSSGAVHASEMYARNLLSMLQLLLHEGDLRLNWQDQIISGCLLTHAGEVYHAPTANLLAVPVALSVAGQKDKKEPLTDQADGWIADDESVSDTGARPVVSAANASVGSHNAQAGSEISAAQSVPPAVHEDESRRDELTLINGIGPALQSRLFAFGYTRFSQLAELDDDGTQRLELQLELDGHITRDNWQGQAAQLSQATR